MQDTAVLMRSMGFSEGEVKTYLAALKKGPTTALELAKEAGYARQSVYEAIESLAKKLLMTTVEKGSKRFFVAEHPEKLLSYLARREQELHELKNDLTRNIKTLELQMGGDRPKVHTYIGKEGVRAIYEDLHGGTELDALEIVDMRALRTVLSPEDLAPIRDEIRRKGIKVRTLYSGEPITNTAQGERYHLPDDFGDFASDVIVYGDKVAMVAFAGDMHSVLVESPSLAKAFKKLFELAFMQAKSWEKK